MRWVTRKTAGFAIFLVVVAAIPFLAYHLFGGVAFEGFGAIGSVITSLLLVALYFRQSSILKSQQDFQRRLERPVLHVEGHRPGKEEGNHSTRPLELLLSNTGRSSARNIELELISGFPEDCSLAPGRTTISLQRADEKSEWNRDWSTYLESGERNVEYQVEPLMVGWYDEEVDYSDTTMSGHQVGYGLLFSRLDDKLNNNRMRLKGAVVYQGPDGTYRDEIFDRIVELSAYGDLGSAVERGERYNNKSGYPIPSEVLDVSYT